MTAQSQTGNRHMSVVEISGTGVAIEGRSGAGKTCLALGLIEAASRRGMEAWLVSDDQAIVEVEDGHLAARAPATIGGQAELRGYGIIRVPHKESCQIGLLARLVPDERVPRMPESATAEVLGVELPVLTLPERHEAQSVRIVLSWLEEYGKAGQRSA